MKAVTTWRRPYREPQLIRMFSGFLALAMSAMACIFVVGFFVGQWTVGPPARVLAAFFVAFLLTFTWRLHRTALVIGDSGVRVRWLLKTCTMRWYEINGFHFGEDVLDVDRLWIDLADGRRVRTPVQRVARMWNGSRLSDGGAWLLYDAADDLLDSLDHELQARRSKA
jgi:hypothetical protein